MSSEHENQERLGRLQGLLAGLIGRSKDFALEAMPGIVAEFGVEDVTWMLGVIAEDVTSSQ